MGHELTFGLMSLVLLQRRIDAVQIKDEAAQFERLRRSAAQKPYCRSSCRLHDGKGSEIPLTLLLGAR